MRFLVLLLPLLSILQFDSTTPRNATAPYITTTLEQLDGSKVSVRFRAVHWDPITTDAIFEDDETRDYYNHYILTRVGELENNVQLAIGSNRLNPGKYYIGVEALKNQAGSQSRREAVFLISDDNNVIMRIPVVLTVEASVVPNLSSVFTPGVTDRDFVFNVLFGNLSLFLKWRFSGVPARPAEIADRQAANNSLNSITFQAPLGNSNSVNQAEIQPTNEGDTPPSPVQRSGLGAVQPMVSNTVADSKTLGGINMIQEDGAAAGIENASMTNANRKAGSGAFRIMKVRP